jgi:hypothetical protein
LAFANVNSRVLFLGFGLSFFFFSSFSSPSTETRTNWKKKKKKKKNFIFHLIFNIKFLSCHLSNLKMQQSRFYLPTPPPKHCTTVYSTFSFSFFPFFGISCQKSIHASEMQSTNPVRAGWIFSQKSRLREREKSIEQLKINALFCISPLCNRSRDVAVLQKNSPYKVRFQLFLLWVSE